MNKNEWIRCPICGSKTRDRAIAQIKDKNYVDALKDYEGNLLLAGISYDKKSKTHTCIIEKVNCK